MAISSMSRMVFDLIDPAQTTFFVLKNVLRIRNELKTQPFCAFIDFKKAFDLVDRDALLYKLRKIGIAGNFYFTVKALYTNAKSCVQVNDRVTD